MTKKNLNSYQLNGVNGKDAGDVHDIKNDVVIDDVTDDDVKCGYGSCKPDGLQRFNNAKILVLVMCVFAFSQGFVVNGVNNVNTQSVERRFRLPSSRSGLISSSYDFSAAIVGAFISFIGSGRYKARWVTIAAVVMGLGSFTMALPHFTTGLYEWGQEYAGDTCFSGAANTTDTKCQASGLQHYLGMLMLGMIFHGVGGSILYTVGVGLIDDSVDSVKSPLYIGILYGAAALGPGFGYIVGGQMLNIYVDFDKVDTSTINLKTDDPRWVGAWWVSFFITMTTTWLIALPLSLFGSEMPTAKKVRETRVSQLHKGKTDQPIEQDASGRLPIKMLPKVTWSLLRNLPFFFVMLTGGSEGIITSGFATFAPKYIQNKFGVSSGTAALYTGAASIPGAAGGMFFGGFICNRLKLKVRGMLKLSIISCLLAMVAVNILWIGCEDATFAGVNTKYEPGGASDNVISACNKDCGCATRYYEPVCSDAGVQYFSACHAGCVNSTEDDNGDKLYSGCACVAASSNSSTVTSGPCESGCAMLYLFLVVFFCVIFLTFLPSTPSDAATLRCIPANYRTFSMGLKWMFIRFLGTVPGPVIFGSVTDTACLIWQDECGEPSSCWIYDNAAVSRNYFLISIAAKIISITLFSLAYFTYTPPPHNDHEPIETRVSSKSQMAFVNGSFRASEYEEKVLDGDAAVSRSGTSGDQKTDL